jgi:hypothetical protein
MRASKKELIVMDYEAYQQAFGSPDPLRALRAIVQKQVEAGNDRTTLLAELERYRAVLRAEGRDQDEDLILEVMDFLVGWCHPDMRI